MVAIVGSRNITTYGKQVTQQLAGELARAGVVVVSGLAIGVDGIAHQAALDAGGLTVAVLPSGLDTIYPARHHRLAQKIVEQGGALITEYPANSTPYKGKFVARNRIVAGLSRAVLVTEASLKSGTLHTARFGLEQGIDVMAVPGNITNTNSVGTNNLIKSGAVPITSADDIFAILGIAPVAARPLPKGNTPQEQCIIDQLAAGISDGAELLKQSHFDVVSFNQALTMLEITGVAKPLGNNQWSL